MSRRAPSTSRAALFVLAAAAIGVSCGEIAPREGLTGPGTARLAGPGAETGGVTASGVSRTLLCHYDEETGIEYDLWLPAAGMTAHLRHDLDRRGSCASTCPCFQDEDVQTVAASCRGTLGDFCDASSNGVYLGLSCTAGQDDPVTIIGLFAARPPGGLAPGCSADTAVGYVEFETLTLDQYEACKTVVETSDYCG